MERYVFPNKARAEVALENMKKLIEWYGVASRADMKDIHGTLPKPEDQKFGWTNLDNVMIEDDPLNFEAVLHLPNALRLE